MYTYLTFPAEDPGLKADWSFHRLCGTLYQALIFQSRVEYQYSNTCVGPAQCRTTNIQPGFEAASI